MLIRKDIFMELYIGGFAQGKLEYVKRRYNENQKTEKLFVKVIDCADSHYKKMLLETECDVLILNHLHLWVRDLLDEGMEEEKIQTTILSWIKSNPDAIVICDELGNGIVPIKKQERIWREQTGRLMIELAKQAERVERILCGLGQRLK